ncbi:MAG: tRNA lysidine(34) synthetase TilS [Bdellovibrionales bacterium CG10_big_fil_rev_8_21_14_0_10_45_34]|nr:MAG: tRNA lysidine(34) synthetase TilS [Bdellovibrionales bacterium CG10_big_fil_rev_8_21_14_0_10_45_34]
MREITVCQQSREVIDRLRPNVSNLEMTMVNQDLLLPLERAAFNQLIRNGLHRQKHLLVALSGGMDSMVLLNLLFKVAAKANVKLSVATIHHGPGSNAGFRDEVFAFCQRVSESYGLPFYSSKSTMELSSEAHMRDFRMKALSEMAQDIGVDAIALGHHLRDQIETQLIRLLRGTGRVGIAGMKVFENGLFRPLLEQPKEEIERYAAACHIQHVCDPSNLQTDFLRNWVRINWILPLEKDHPEKAKVLVRSLENLSQLPEEGLFEPSSTQKDTPLDRTSLLEQSTSKQIELIRAYGRANSIDLTFSQIQELLKHFRRPQNSLQVRVGRGSWRVDAKHIFVEL